MGNAPRLMNYFCVVLPIIFFESKLLFFGCLLAAVSIKEYTILPIAFILLALHSIKHSRKLILPLILIFIVAAGLIVSVYRDSVNRSIEIRWKVWKPTIEQIFKKPLCGFGLGVFPHVSSQFLDLTVPTITGEVLKYKAETTFNSYLQFIFGAGLFAVAWIEYAFKTFKEKFKYSIDNYVVLSIALLALIEYPFEISRLWITICALFGFYLIKNHEKGEIKYESQICG